jgi:hypothetical protein
MDHVTYHDEEVDIPNIHDAGTTASEFDGALDAPGDDDEVTEDTGVVGDTFEDEASAEEPKHQKVSKKVCNEPCRSHASS